MMSDQANKLRDLMLSKQKGGELKKNIKSEAPRVITISSGKSGVGKSNLAVNLAVQFAKLDMRCVLIDADFKTSKASALMGIEPKYSFLDVINGGKTITDILADGPAGIMFISGGAGFSELSVGTNRQNLHSVEDSNQISLLNEKIAPLDDISDIIIIDTGTGMSNMVVDFVSAGSENLMLITPEAASITDAYAVIKRAKEQNADLPVFGILVNRAESKSGGDEVFAKLERACNKFLGVELNNMGFLPHDANVLRAVKAKQPVSLLYPDSDLSKSIDQLIELLVSLDTKDISFQVFLSNLIKKFNNN